MTREGKAVAGLVTVLIGLAITLSGHWLIGNALSLAGVAFSILVLAKGGD